MMKVKVCPSCNKLNDIETPNCLEKNCGYIFTGEESGIKKNQISIDIPENVPSINEIKIHKDSLNRDELNEESEASFFSKQLGFSFVLILGGLILALVLWPIYRKSNLTIPGATFLIFLGGLGLVFFGIIHFIITSKSSKSEVNYSNPRIVLRKNFYDQVLPFDLNNYARAWNSLTFTAQNIFKTFEGFKGYWESMKEFLEGRTRHLLAREIIYRKDWIPLYDFTFRINHIENKKDWLSFAVVEVHIRQTRQSPDNNYKIYDGSITFKQIKALISHEERWFLTSGTCDLSEEYKKEYYKAYLPCPECGFPNKLKRFQSISSSIQCKKCDTEIK